MDKKSGKDVDRVIRDFEKVDKLAVAVGFELQADNAMPANNRLLVWRKSPCGSVVVAS